MTARRIPEKATERVQVGKRTRTQHGDPGRFATRAGRSAPRRAELPAVMRVPRPSSQQWRVHKRFLVRRGPGPELG